MIKSEGTIEMTAERFGLRLADHFSVFFQQLKLRQPVGCKIPYKPSYQELGDWIFSVVSGLKQVNSFEKNSRSKF
jgi:hypothetical protein